MDKRYGVVHSGGKKIIPLGDSLCLRFMLDDYQKGSFWNRKMANHDKDAQKIYMQRRTYKQQIQDAVKEGAKELVFVVDTPKNDFRKIREFILEIYNMCRKLGYRGEIIFSNFNEPLEHASTNEIITVINQMAWQIRQLDGASLAIGGMASEFTSFYRRIAREVAYYDYIDFHTSNDGNIWSIDWLSKYLPQDKPLINTEHYLWNCGFEHGYDSDECVKAMKMLTDYMFQNKRIKSIYVCMPSAYVKDFKYNAIALRYVNERNDVIYSTRMWYLLKLYEKGEEVMAKLKELKRGDKGFQVTALQDMLNTVGDTELKVDGIFGAKTEAAVEKYQKKVGLKETGICDYSTWYMLFVDKKYPVGYEVLTEMLKVM